LSYTDGTPRLIGTVFAALLARAAVSQAAFARLAGITPHQVSKWCRGQAAVPVWAGLIAVMLLERFPEDLAIDLEEASQRCPTPRPSPR
jgi:transcriptional regulator with XRE-family HTH domain